MQKKKEEKFKQAFSTKRQLMLKLLINRPNIRLRLVIANFCEVADPRWSLAEINFLNAYEHGKCVQKWAEY